MSREDQIVEKGISDIVGCFCDCLVVYPGGWHDVIPPELKQAITMERMIALMKAHRGIEEETATDAECCAYLMTAAFVGPLDHDWSQIYLYLATKYMRDHKNAEVPEDIKVDEMTDYQHYMLKDMKRDIYRTRTRQRTETRKSEKRERKEAEEARQPVVIQERLF